jgi:hypothetical protein
MKSPDWPRFMGRRLSDGKTEERQFDTAAAVPPGEGWMTIDELEGRPPKGAAAAADPGPSKALKIATDALAEQSQKIVQLESDVACALNYADALEKILDEVEAAAPDEIKESLRAKRDAANALMSPPTAKPEAAKPPKNGKK